jgi:UDP-N-acetylglucosamine--dolichyl-phosphate N-acetylglucosaminephosphotransferase
MLDTFSVLGLGIAFVVTFTATFVATPTVAQAMKKRGIVGKDVHKLSQIEIPEMCGLAVIIGLIIGTGVYALFWPGALREVAAFAGTILIAGAIGIVDDLHPLGARTKPVLTALACIPILVLGTYVPYAYIPLVGLVRFTIVYPLLIPVAIAVTSNSINMMDVMNGAMPGTVAIISFTMVGLLLWSGETITATLAGALLAAMLAYFYFNRYPAKVFGGDTGSLSVGAAIGALAIFGRIEAVTVVALIPHIMNSFYGLASVRGLRERREILQRPTRLLENGLLQASTEKGAPVTLARLILLGGPWGERKVVKGMMLLTAVSCVLAVFTYWIMVTVVPVR